MPVPEKVEDDSPKTAREKIYSKMLCWIIDGTLKPDEKIFDRDIAEYFSVSRTPVREALQTLEEQKLVIVSPGRESRVAPVDISQIIQSYEIIAELEGMAVRYAIGKTTGDFFSRQIKINQLFEEALKTGDAIAAKQADHKFHDSILKLSENDFLRKFCETLENHISRAEIQFFARNQLISKLLISVKEHEAIISSMKNKNTEQAVQVMKDNWLNTIPYLKSLHNQ